MCHITVVCAPIMNMFSTLKKVCLHLMDFIYLQLISAESDLVQKTLQLKGLTEVQYANFILLYIIFTKYT